MSDAERACLRRHRIWAVLLAAGAGYWLWRATVTTGAEQAWFAVVTVLWLAVALREGQLIRRHHRAADARLRED